MSASSKLIEKVTARVFCSQGGGGGNPVTIFSSMFPTSKETRVALAKSCDWESVVVDVAERRLSFFMPNGDSVRFCAHAAMGGALVLGGRSDDRTVTFSVDHDTTTNETSGYGKYNAVIHDPGDVVSLEVHDRFSFRKVAHPPALHRILRDSFGLSGSDLIEPTVFGRPRHPTFANATVFGRPKTLVYVNSLATLQTVRVPPVGPSFVAACDALASTGIYLYSSAENDGEYECRQFPRSSGYPEDPATGVAAAALACSLSYFGIRSAEEGEDSYRFVQGTAMQRPSVLLIERIAITNDGGHDGESSVEEGNPVAFRLMGHVQLDQREMIRVGS